MSREISIQARWDDDAGVWIATSNDVPGLVIEAETWPAMIDEVKVTLPELVEVSGGGNEPLSLTFKAEQHLDLAGA
jgi:hypothetical protein